MKSNKVKLRGRLRKSLYWPMFMTILLVCMNVVIYTEDILSGIMFSIFTAIYFVVSMIVYVRNKPVLVNELINFATQYGTVQKQLLNEFEIPYALVDYNAKILWVNEQFTELTGKDKKYHKSITTIFPALTKELLQKSDGEKSINLTLKEQDFRVALKRIYFEELNSVDSLVTLDESNEYLTAVYLFDETEKNQYMRENQEQKMVAGLVYIDNYDEALDSIEDVKRSLLVALIDRKVNKYFTELDALVRKIEKDKYFVVLKYQYLAKLREDRFSLIEDVKTVKVGNEMAVTLSIGIGANGESYTQNYEYARMSIDLALGRGGDQVVVRDGEDITYYGGKTQQVERNTRVKARVKAHALREDDVCSLVAVPYFNNAKLESFLITYVRMKDNWHSSVNRYMLDEDDLNMYQLLFREVKYSLNRLDAYDKIYEMNNKLYLAAVTDQLTGIYNREGFYRRIKDLIDEFSGGKRKPELGLMFIDLDNFKHYNDTYGHDVGDLVLKEMADIFSGLCEKQGFVCRYGGDEYIIVFFTADKERLKETAKQIYQKIDQADGFEKAISEKLKKQISIRKEQRISCSIGIVLAEDIHGEEEINQMIKRADDLLYSIKTTKKGTYRI